MKQLALSIAVLALQMSSHAFAETYHYTGAKFTLARGEYTTNMRVMGTIVTSNPIPPDSFELDITGMLNSWSFHDGVQTIDNVNGVIDPRHQPWVTTDNLGNITQADLRLFLYPMANDTGVWDSWIKIVSGTPDEWSSGVHNANCLFPKSGYCGGYHRIADQGYVSLSGSWQETNSMTNNVTVPALSKWSLLLLTLLLGIIGFAWVRRKA